MRWVADYKLLYDHTTEHCEHQWLAVFATAPALQAALPVNLSKVCKCKIIQNHVIANLLAPIDE